MASDKETVTINLTGKISSENADTVEKSILKQLEGKNNVSVVLDASELEYISSAGLRVLLHIRKDYPDIIIVDVNPEVYDILNMTGFTDLMKVEKAYRSISLEGAEEIGRGANGVVYRVQGDSAVKVYYSADSLAEIQHEREVAKLALILGIPTAISYDVVKVGDSYGSMFELLNPTCISNILAEEPEKMDWCVKEYVEMLKKIHGTLVPPGKLPDMRETALSWARFMQDYLPEEAGKKLISLIEAVPHDDHMLHGDYHTKNMVIQKDEVLLIDMDTLAVGHPIFELASMYNSFIGYSEYNHDTIIKFQGFDWQTGKTFWYKSLAAYLGTQNEEKIREVEDKARIIGYTRMIRRSIRRKGLETEEGRAEIDLWKGELLKLLEKADTLLFKCNELEIDALTENLSKVQAFVDEYLEAADCPLKAQMQISVAVEEIFINIASYAYEPGVGKATIRVEVTEDPSAAVITFIDRGIPYDPLAKEDPDVTLTAEERAIGGLGIFMAKEIMDEEYYEYKDGQNILTLKKYL